MLCAAAAGGSHFRTLDSGSLLQVVQNDSGETSRYYALRYFGAKQERKIDQLLWNDLKKYGHVDMDRGAKLDSPARWFPIVHAGAAFRAPRVRRYKPEDNDLSVLQMSDDLARVQENAVLDHLHGEAPIEIPRDRGIGAPAPAPPVPESRSARKSRWSSELSELAEAAKGTALPAGNAPKSE